MDEHARAGIGPSSHERPTEEIVMSVAGAGGYFFTVVRNTLYAVGGLPTGSWEPNWNNPPFTPVECVAGDYSGTGELFVIDTSGVIQTVGAINNSWGSWNSNVFPALPNDRRPVRFVGYSEKWLTVIDNHGICWSIGNFLPGGASQWGESKNLVPPA
jgi:hypothetical protein